MDFGALPRLIPPGVSLESTDYVLVDIDESDSGTCLTAGSTLSSLRPSTSSSGVSVNASAAVLVRPGRRPPETYNSILDEVVVDNFRVLNEQQLLLHDDDYQMRRLVRGLETAVMISQGGFDISEDRDSSILSVDSSVSLLGASDLEARVVVLESFAESVSPGAIRPYNVQSSRRRCAAFIRCLLCFFRSPSPPIILLRKVFLFFFSNMICDWLLYAPCDWVESRGLTFWQLLGKLCSCIRSVCCNR
ncbi:hypothetical protein Ark11_1252 [Candidatus Ichthyocystis hellenicum]|uniref:Uncharacterized protein n=1 Tax=Candidatus Ichthyocystis hellenicum TaxID=1561003 RepID=A0A0S4M5Q5_9BURK|nr:hypothetical protein [Candidatus Ichthyocystis hellenicum]CUT18058.1 hypothetical protein Ark11_1252 [Candidatus Ichthyocystis hellenicum]